jgi:hypothetical protein
MFHFKYYHKLFESGIHRGKCNAKKFKDTLMIELEVASLAIMKH